MASEPLDDITRRRMAIDQARQARREAKIADSIAKTEARRAAAAATCADPDALRASLERSLAVSTGQCPLCERGWGAHDPDSFRAHYEAVFGDRAPTPSTPGAA